MSIKLYIKDLLVLKLQVSFSLYVAANDNIKLFSTFILLSTVDDSTKNNVFGTFLLFEMQFILNTGMLKYTKLEGALYDLFVATTAFSYLMLLLTYFFYLNNFKRNPVSF